MVGFLCGPADPPGFDKQGNHGKYDIEYKGRQYSDTRGLVLQYGSLVRVYRIADLSNGEIDEVSCSALLQTDFKAEFDRFLRTSQADNVPIPKRSALRRKHEAIVALRDRVMTEVSFSFQCIQLTFRTRSIDRWR